MEENEGMIYKCPWCGVPRHVSLLHNCDQHILRVKIDNLQAELNWCETKVESIEAERDEARQWAYKFWQESEYLRQNQLDDAHDIAELWASNGEADKEIGELKAQLATARNDALDEAMAVLDQVHRPIKARAKNAWSGSAYAESFRLWQVRNLTEKLKTE